MMTALAAFCNAAVVGLIRLQLQLQWSRSGVLRIANPNPNPNPRNSKGQNHSSVVKHRAQSYGCVLCVVPPVHSGIAGLNI